VLTHDPLYLPDLKGRGCPRKIDEHYEMPASDPIEAIFFRMDQDGLTQRDLEVYIGPSGRVSEVLNKKRPLTIGMIKRLHNGLNIPYESLLAD